MMDNNKSQLRITYKYQQHDMKTTNMYYNAKMNKHWCQNILAFAPYLLKITLKYDNDIWTNIVFQHVTSNLTNGAGILYVFYDIWLYCGLFDVN